MAKTLNCPTCGGKSINRRPKMTLCPDGVWRETGPKRCYYLGGFSGRVSEQCRAFWCKESK